MGCAVLCYSFNWLMANGCGSQECGPMEGTDAGTYKVEKHNEE